MKALLLLLCLLLNGCINLPPAIKNAPNYDVSYAQANQSIANFRTAPVRWGGVIVGVDNQQTYTQLEVLSYPLNFYGRPQLNQTSEGRFLVKSTDFLDPAVYGKDKEITVAGMIDGDVNHTVGHKAMRLPLIAASVIHLWPVETERNYNGGFGYPSFYYGHPFYWGGYYRPYR